jgi:hypothetical protein
VLAPAVRASVPFLQPMVTTLGLLIFNEQIARKERISRLFDLLPRKYRLQTLITGIN